jgi:toxin ParE1/3/4
VGASFSLTRAARTDLKSIASYTQHRWGKQQRKLYVKQFDDAFHMLAENPETGVTCDFIKQGYRKFPNGSHVIFYRSLEAGAIQIVRILHKRMDVARQMFDYTNSRATAKGIGALPSNCLGVLLFAMAMENSPK